MKTIKRITASVLLAVILCVSALPISVSADTTLVYSTAKNSGTRHVVCTTLDGTSAPTYYTYTGDYAYSTLSKLEGEALYDKLNELMTDTHKKTSSYDDCRDMPIYTDCENEDGRINLIYTSYSATKADWTNTNGVWNREHVWPQSLGGFNYKKGDVPAQDMHHVRPSDKDVNSTRDNLLYGNVSSGKNAVSVSKIGSIVGGKYNGTYFEPLDNVKGDVARICLYVYVRYGEEYTKCSSITNVFSDIDTLLEWCALDPVDTWEMGRNEVVGAYQGNRNVFIDYPEYAWLLFEREIPDDLTTPTSASNGDAGGDVGGGDTDGDTSGCEHKNAELRGVMTADCYTKGFSGNLYCPDCKTIISKGEEIQKTTHRFIKLDGDLGLEKCENCGEARSVSDGKNDAVIVAVAVSSGTAVAGGGAACFFIIRKRRLLRLKK